MEDGKAYETGSRTGLQTVRYARDVAAGFREVWGMKRESRMLGRCCSVGSSSLPVGYLE